MSGFASKVHHWNRSRKWKLFVEKCLESDSTTVLDAGFQPGAGKGWENTLEHSITNHERVTGLTIDPVPGETQYPGMTVVSYDGRIFPFEDESFDVCWSNAVVEHVGGDAEMIQFVSEIKRVSKKAFVTTPNKYFPVEPHTKMPLVHLLPQSMFDAILHRAGKGSMAGDYMDLLGERRFRRVLEAAGVTEYELHKNRAGPFTMDFVAIF